MITKRLCFALDLKNDPKLIQGYIEHHQKVWPEILDSIKDAGIINMEIYNVSNRLFMVMEVTNEFSLKTKGEKDRNNTKVQEWENLMDTFQQKLPGTPKGEKWVQMTRIFKL
ncbi:L-rhamnose mutarotase [Maribacter algicola]|uniref:L-rhamnose mutarotase n=1 Tax=Maribacter algicola TaxID=2498892 RepID=A0A426RGB3_9FLAO|nr:L-rhamnose mutarotase [Maribacter algicola]RRQ48004.1 L-rhamnose mutarotase [Maribacter algicola]